MASRRSTADWCTRPNGPRRNASQAELSVAGMPPLRSAEAGPPPPCADRGTHQATCPEVSAGLHRLQMLSVRVEQGPARDAPLSVADATNRLREWGTCSRLWTSPDDHEPRGGDPLVDRKVVDRDVRDIEQYYHRAAVRAARITFFCGMLIGLVGRRRSVGGRLAWSRSRWPERRAGKSRTPDTVDAVGDRDGRRTRPGGACEPDVGDRGASASTCVLDLGRGRVGRRRQAETRMAKSAAGRAGVDVRRTVSTC